VTTFNKIFLLAGNPYLVGRLSTVDLVELTCLDSAFDTEIIIYLCYQTRYLNKEVKRTDPSPSDSFPCFRTNTFHLVSKFKQKYFVLRQSFATVVNQCVPFYDKPEYLPFNSSVMTFSKLPLSIMTLGIIAFNDDAYHNTAQHNCTVKIYS
jgi:hypothetical protein